MYHPHFRKKKNGTPILSIQEINSIAEGYINDFCTDLLVKPQPLNVDSFIESYLGLTLDYQYLSNDGRYLGMTVFNDTSGVKIYNPEKNSDEYYTASAGTVIIDTTLTSDNQLNRYRYTAGHESGHWLLHRGYYYYDPNQLTFFELTSPYIKCRATSLDIYFGDTHNWSDERWMEWQADKFSSCLLMPRAAVIVLMKNNESYGFDEEEIVLLTSETFKVSREAAYYRLKDLGIIKTDNNGQFSFI